MAFFEVKNVKIAGFSAGVPANITRNDVYTVDSKDYNVAAFIETTGVRQRRISNKLTTSDLCYGAAEKLISDLKWDKSEIGILIFVSQTADYYFPATSCILQARLGLNEECYAADISLGCSGWVYGLSNIVSLMSSGSVKKALLLVGDAKPHVPCDDPLFGFAGTATALEYCKKSENIYFHFGTNGRDYETIIIPDGGCRNQVTPNSFNLEEVDGKMINRLTSRMKGMDVFSFGLSTAPKSVKKLIEHYNLSLDNLDYLVLHQANMLMNEKIRNKLKIDASKVPYSLPNFGNTSSASIPLTIVTELKGKIEKKSAKFICCGFGVGLSWGTVAFETNNIVISDLVEL